MTDSYRLELTQREQQLAAEQAAATIDPMVEKVLEVLDQADLDVVQGWIDAKRGVGVEYFESDPLSREQALEELMGPSPFSEAQQDEAQTVVGCIAVSGNYARHKGLAGLSEDPGRFQMMEYAAQELMRYGPVWAMRHVFPWVNSGDIRLLCSALMSRCKVAENRLEEATNA